MRVGSTQNRLRLTPYAFATFCDLRGRDRPLVELVLLHQFERRLLVQVPLDVDTGQISRGAVRPGPCFQYGLRRSDVILFTSLSVNA